MSMYGSIVKNSLRFLLNYLSRFLLTCVVATVCWIPIQYYSWFSWHVILCTLGYVPLMAEAFMLLKGDELWTKQLSHRSRYIAHGVLITLATGMTIVGNSMCFYYIESGYHLYTVHGITGLISMILLIFSLGTGLLTFYSDKFKNRVRPVVSKFIHNSLGLLGFIIGIISLCFAYYTNWFVYYTTYEIRLATCIVTVIGSLWCMNGALVSGYNQLKTILDR